jgi:hypothetical protein
VLDNIDKMKGRYMKYIVICSCVLVLGTVVVLATGSVESQGSGCGGSDCTTTVTTPNQGTKNITVPCSQETVRAAQGSSHQSGSLCGKCDFGGGYQLTCGWSTSGNPVTE